MRISHGLIGNEILLALSFSWHWLGVIKAYHNKVFFLHWNLFWPQVSTLQPMIHSNAQASNLGIILISSLFLTPHKQLICSIFQLCLEDICPIGSLFSVSTVNTLVCHIIFWLNSCERILASHPAFHSCLLVIHSLNNSMKNILKYKLDYVTPLLKTL